MTLHPITIDGVAQANAVVEFRACDDMNFNGDQFLERVVADANGVAVLTADVPSGKLLYADVDVEDGAERRSRSRFFTDNF